MEKCKRKSVDPVYSMCVQPSFIIGTNNEDGSYNFAPITWVSATQGEDEGYFLVISMFGTKMTKLNVIRTGVFSANLVSKDMLSLMDYFGSKHAKDGKKDDISYGVSRGEVLDVPTLDASRWVYECEVVRSVETGDSTTFFCRIRNIQMDERLSPKDIFDIDLSVLDPVIYSGKYHSIDKVLGSIGDFCKSDRT
ncbi:flavin reductase [Butyrivibrio sp. CB08]|uniref:flavin reductase family protein n=1 Tax=Butyrivibrio sp. CB08 TaxID=2364879 RepID=UPI000EAA9EAD|nr:flavin reductase family protein [Butyrivibrio sp. CB08]RKM62142.1 flavin reductase [Butyrivibrio sp. CB08]